MSKIKNKIALFNGFDTDNLLLMMQSLEEKLSKDKNVELNIQSDGSGTVTCWDYTYNGSNEEKIFDFETIEQLYEKLKDKNKCFK